MEKLTPLMEQYMKIKEEYKDCILFYRLGDFYEMFFEDAKICSKVLEITLTGKNCGMEERAPMCGVPYHAVDSYLSKMIANGYKVAICEQVEDPKLTKGLVKRDVTRIVTPGTNLNTQELDEGKNNYIMSIVLIGAAVGIAAADITTGEFLVTQVDSPVKAQDEIYKLKPSEILCNMDFYDMPGNGLSELTERLHTSVSCLDSSSAPNGDKSGTKSWYFNRESCENCLMEHFHVGSLNGLGLSDFPSGVTAAGSLMLYLKETQKNGLTQINSISPYISSQYMLLDSATRRNLEITETLREKQKRGSLLWVLDKTKTAMGARCLRKYIEQPLVDVDKIIRRQDALSMFNSSAINREELREYLSPVYDLERLISKVAYESANPRDLLALKQSLEMLPYIRNVLKEYDGGILKEAWENIDELQDIYGLLNDSIVEEPPIGVREGGIIKEGYHPEVDRLRKAKTEGKTWLAEMEAREKEKTGIKNLRIKFNKVFGYYLEVTNSFKDQVPMDWVRKQTLANAERYTTDELKKLEDVILGAEDRLFGLEYDIFCEVRRKIYNELKRIQKTAGLIGKVDALSSMALVSEQNGYVRPLVHNRPCINIKEGRHPVVEQMQKNQQFVANDTYLDENHSISIITGPNMAGKSTYMRQTALIVLMAQIGCFVPAAEADIGIADRIFTRVGASDDLASGQSTFMVEMTEVANILRNATKKSLIILDEIGRGTSTFDGLSIAWAVVEYISDRKRIGARTLFATHYHELTELEGKLDNVDNYCVAVKEQGEDIVFLRKIIKGGADKSYGIQVAKLAGVPKEVLSRAGKISEALTENDITRVKDVKSTGFPAGQISLFDNFAGFGISEGEKKALDKIRNMDMNGMTPMEAMNLLYELQKELN